MQNKLQLIQPKKLGDDVPSGAEEEEGEERDAAKETEKIKAHSFWQAKLVVEEEKVRGQMKQF